ncbi:MAG: ABC transporter ATP-binding protein [Pseudomonadota bacterium]
MSGNAAPAFAIRGLSVAFGRGAERVQALDGVDLDVARGEVRAVVGESGCGKSVTAMAALGLLPPNAARVRADAIRLGDTDLTAPSPRDLRAVRGGRIGMVFQDPMNSLNPVLTLGLQIAETVRRHRGVSRRAALDRAREMLDLVRIPDPDARLHAYPHELSGGMRQRAMIAIALACEPELLIADEPTTALDVTVQAQVLDLILSLQDRMGLAVLLITHDLGVVARTADRMTVMYAGRVVEEGRVAQVFAHPSHGYTAGLMRALPTMGTRERLQDIPGSVPRLAEPAPACAFATRCAFAEPACSAAPPPLVTLDAHHRTRCLRAEVVAAAMADDAVPRAWREAGAANPRVPA